jgi:hypothetical protein
MKMEENGGKSRFVVGISDVMKVRCGDFSHGNWDSTDTWILPLRHMKVECSTGTHKSRKLVQMSQQKHGPI